MTMYRYIPRQRIMLIIVMIFGMMLISFGISYTMREVKIYLLDKRNCISTLDRLQSRIDELKAVIDDTRQKLADSKQRLRKSEEERRWLDASLASYQIMLNFERQSVMLLTEAMTAHTQTIKHLKWARVILGRFARMLGKMGLSKKEIRAVRYGHKPRGKWQAVLEALGTKVECATGCANEPADNKPSAP